MTTKAITSEFRVSWPHVFKAQKNDLNGKDEFSVIAIFPLNADLSGLKAIALEALKEKFGADQTKWSKTLRSPFRKCKEKWKEVTDEKTGKTTTVIPAGFEDGEATWINFKSTSRPGVVDEDVQDILEERNFYSGCYAIADVNANAYDQKGNKGVSIYLNNVQKRRDGEPLGGKSSPSAAFKPVAGASSSSSAADSVFD